MLVRVDVVPAHVVFQFSICTSDPLPTKQGICLSRLGAAGSDLHLVVPPERRDLRLHFCLLAWLGRELQGYPIC